MTYKLKALGLALFAILALSATMASAASALSIFDSASTPTILTGTSENTQVFTRGSVQLQCTHAQFKGTQVGLTTNEISLEAEYTTPTCTGPLGSEVHWDFTTHACRYKLTGTASKTASFSVTCIGGTGILETPTVFGSSLCTITVPPQTTSGHVVFVNYNEGTLKSVTAEMTATGISSTRTGSELCGPASDTTATWIGNWKITGYDDVSGGTESGQHNIEVT